MCRRRPPPASSGSAEPLRAAFTRSAALAAYATGVGCATIGLALAPAAQAGSTQLSVFQDDKLLVLSEPSTRERTLDDLALLGVDTIHSIVFWNRVAPSPLERTRPQGFDGSDPAAYPPEQWDRYDGLVRGANARGMELILAPSSPLPYWASRCRGGSKIKRTCRPDPTQFKRFVEALGKRYSGDYADENQGGGLLPRVSRWAVWNEPNQGGWLTPQCVRRNGRLLPLSPGLYRGLVRAAIKAPARQRPWPATRSCSARPLRSAASPGPAIDAADGARRVPARRSCASTARGARCAGHRAAALDCTGRFSKLAGHGDQPPPVHARRQPAADRAGAGPTRSRSPRSARLKTILRQAARSAAASRAGLPIYYTEFGFQTNPPGHDLRRVARAARPQWLNQSDWIAWHDPQVKSVAQYELRDEADLAAFQTGLRFIDGRAQARLRRLPAADLGQARGRGQCPCLGPGPPRGRRRARDRRDPERPGGRRDVPDRRDRHDHQSQGLHLRARAVRTPVTGGSSGRPRTAGLRSPAALRESPGGESALVGVAAAAAAAAALVAAPAHAAENLQYRDRATTHPARARPSGRRRSSRAGRRWAIEVVRIHARWVAVAPGDSAAVRAARLRLRPTPTTPLQLGASSTAR